MTLEAVGRFTGWRGWDEALQFRGHAGVTVGWVPKKSGSAKHVGPRFFTHQETGPLALPHPDGRMPTEFRSFTPPLPRRRLTVAAVPVPTLPLVRGDGGPERDAGERPGKFDGKPWHATVVGRPSEAPSPLDGWKFAVRRVWSYPGT